MISSLPVSMARVPMTLRGLVVCVACDEFPDASIACPSRGSGEYRFLSHILKGSVLNVTGLNRGGARRRSSSSPRGVSAQVRRWILSSERCSATWRLQMVAASLMPSWGGTVREALRLTLGPVRKVFHARD